MVKKRATNKKVIPPAPPLPVEPQQPVNEAGRKMEVLINMMEWDDTMRLKGLKTKSAMIRHLWGEGYTRSAIAKFIGCKYQMVRNILVQVPKRQTTVATEPSGDASPD